MFVVDATALRKAREARGWSVANLAARAGVSERTVTRLEASDAPSRPDTVECVAKALGVPVAAIIGGPASSRRARRAPPAAPAPSAVPPVVATFTLPPRTTLDSLALLESKAGLSEKPLVDGVPRLLAKSLQDVNTANRGHRGRQFWIRGLVDRQRGLTADEANLLSSRRGDGARFLVLHESAGDETIAVVLHVPLVADVVALQAAMDTVVTLTVEVFGVGDDVRGGFSTFWSDATRDWTFRLVRRVVGGAKKR